MDWSRAKTIFIISFLILDIFLAYQLIYQKNENTFETLPEASFDQQLKAENITVTKLPTEPKKSNYVEARTKQFDFDDTLTTNQTISIASPGITSELLEPYTLKENWKVEDIDAFIKSYVYNGDQYQFWSFNSVLNEITYYQVFNGRMIYNNDNAKIKILLNGNEIVGYNQTMLENIEEVLEQDIITALEALKILYSKGLIRSDSNVSKVEIGYNTLVSNPTSSSQLLAPTWRFTINDEQEYFVNAIEGHVFNEASKILE